MIRENPSPKDRSARAPAARSLRGLNLPIPDTLLDDIADRVLALMGERQNTRWLTVEQAAAHLACSKHRLYGLASEERVPHHHEGRRLVFDKAELDRWVRAGGAQ